MIFLLWWNYRAYIISIDYTDWIVVQCRPIRFERQRVGRTRVWICQHKVMTGRDLLNQQIPKKLFRSTILFLRPCLHLISYQSSAFEACRYATDCRWVCWVCGGDPDAPPGSGQDQVPAPVSCASGRSRSRGQCPSQPQPTPPQRELLRIQEFVAE